MLAGAAISAHALDYRSIAAPAILYDSPSTKGKPLYIINAGTPVESVVAMDGWFKVRDMQGGLAWVESKQVSDKRTVQVRVDRAPVLAQPNEKAPQLFEAERDVVMDLLESTGTGWVKVRHRDGQVGYVKTLQVWGL
ncbi:MAG TPA: SH3 domain-containing protein [Rhodocyclaceae bacterium]|nr:SH3 domain-containing protein [Rhodocyclaceae bacterium]